MPLQTIEPTRLYRQIAEQIRALIARGEFAVGARLPAERDLSRQLGVSRPSVREALIALEVEGWVEVRTGSGIYVLDRQPRGGIAMRDAGAAAARQDEWGPLELLRARRVLEGETAAIAARQRLRRHLDQMRRAQQRMRDLADSGTKPLEGDRAFHLAIAEAGDNAVLTATIRDYWDSRTGPIATRLGDHFESAPIWRASIDEHEAILAAIAARDPDAAREAMHRHLDKSHQRFSASWRRAPRRAAPAER